MLNRVIVNNFRCLQSVDVPLKPFTVIVGKNNSGKSSLLSAIHLLGIASSGNAHYEPAKFRKTDIWKLGEPSSAQIEGFSETGNVEVRRNGDFWTRKGDANDIQPISFFNSSFLKPAMKSGGAATKEGVPRINDMADNTPAILDVLLRKDRDRFFLIVDTLKELVPGLTDLNIETPTSQEREIKLSWEDGFEMNAVYASYGVTLMIFFVTLANHPDPPNTILVEEPETGVHPGRLKHIADLLIRLADGKFGPKPTQVVVTTHSPYFLDCVNPDEHQVLVTRRLPSGQCDAKPVDLDNLKLFLDEFMLGEIWFNQKEEGLIGKES
jgi:predicted ATPase